MSSTPPNRTPIRINPILREELDRVVLRCWPEREAIDRLFGVQGTIGMAAWDGDRCVGQLHSYRVALPSVEADDRPECKDWWLAAASEVEFPLAGPAWCLTCYHVGRTLDAFCVEMLDKEVFPVVGNTWDEPRILGELKKHVPNLDEQAVSRILQERRAGVDHGETFWGGCEQAYFGQGIGAALCEAAVRWARENDYVAVLAPAPPAGLIEYARWSGHLPQTTYARLGFTATVVPPEEGDAGWTRGEIHEPIASEVREALASGRQADELLERLMVLDLRSA